MRRMVGEPGIEGVGRIFRPVDAHGVGLRIVLRQIPQQRAGVGADVRAGEAAVPIDARRRDAAVRQPRLVLGLGPAELHAVARRDRRLHLQLHLEPAPLGRPQEFSELAALGLGQRIGLGRPVAQPGIECGLRREAGRRPAGDLALAPQQPVEQPHRPGPGIDRRLPPSGTLRHLLHDIGRGDDRRRPCQPLQVVEQRLDALDLDPFRHHRNAEPRLPPLSHASPPTPLRPSPSPAPISRPAPVCRHPVKGARA